MAEKQKISADICKKQNGFFLLTVFNELEEEEPSCTDHRR